MAPAQPVSSVQGSVFQPGPIIGGIIGGLLGLFLAVSLALFLDRRRRLQRTRRHRAGQADDLESISVSTYIDDKELDSLYSHSPTENSPALRPVTDRPYDPKPLRLADIENSSAARLSALPPPFPSYGPEAPRRRSQG
ncbi:hypothetical protein TWF694_003211 [Orbilia ellipsospora]|uniref:Uncharacterized protein n=1 Tax=Orbilia ellipsospora TaxID=2528407 RepID=A0AAV9X0X7_9PEZI